MRYFDLHCDTPYECYQKKLPFAGSGLAGADGAGCFSAWKQTFAFWIRDDAPQPFALYQGMMADFKEKIRQHPPELTPVYAIEGGAVLEDKIERLDRLKADGIRLFGLTWNGKNRIASGAGETGGLTAFGRQVIGRLNELSMACDLSHLNDQSFGDAVALAAHPVATHSCCRAVCDVPRNLTDGQLGLIAEKGGVIGLCLYPLFLGGDVFERFYAHIRHMLALGLEDAIAVGSDFDGAKMDSRMDSVAKIPALARYLKEKGLSGRLLDRIFFENADKMLRNL